LSFVQVGHQKTLGHSRPLTFEAWSEPYIAFCVNRKPIAQDEKRKAELGFRENLQFSLIDLPQKTKSLAVDSTANSILGAHMKTLAIVLAAGEGTRMKSATPKVLHKVAGLSMVGHVLSAVKSSVATSAAIVIGPNRDDVGAEAARFFPGISKHVQEERLGTAHAVLHARADLAQAHDVVIVLFADTPLVRPETITRLGDAVLAGNAVVGLGFRAADPTGYGRFLMDGDALVAIREHKDATESERRINLCNAGLMALDGRRALEIIERIGNANAQKEYYLTDAVEVARSLGLQAAVVEAPEDEVMGVNDRVQLAEAELVFQKRARDLAMRSGVTLVDPASTFFAHDTKIGRDVIVEPNVFFGNNVSIGDRSFIRASSHIEDSEIGEDCEIGPFARLRPGTKLARKAKIGNFVEIKNADVGVGAKVNHLSYVGDATIGSSANIGAGVVTCNYDGFLKHRTVVGEGAFVGTNSSLVAPVTIGDGAYVGSASVITENVPADALALGRARQTVKDGWASRFRAVMQAKKAAKKSG
jgi:bifunctional UDP-N-acetylglucosamine pyrophosphorylase / glucosamine-1-phosphate N-acetyltransferase